jgi:putative ABC transport system permease protein
MTAIRSILVRFCSIFQTDSAERLDEELQAHAELLAADYMARGVSETEARYAARRELGNITSLRQEYRERSGLPFLENAWFDLKCALRTLRRNPAFTASCVATLAIGLGAMITVLCVVSAFLWTPLPYPTPKSLIVIKDVDPRNGSWTFSEPTLLDLEERSRLLSVIAAYRRDNLVLTAFGDAEAISSAAITPSLFKLTGMAPTAGSLFTNSGPMVVISRELWKRKWQMDPLVVGRTIVLAGQSYTVAGIGDLPGDLLPGVELLFPLTPKASESRTAHDIEVVARIKDGAALGQVQAELNTVASAIDREHSQTNAGWGMRLIPLRDFLIGSSVSTIWMIFAAVALLWLLACANVAGLQIARSVARKHEMGTRLALGASRARLLTQTMTESMVLAVAGLSLGAIIAEYATSATQHFGSEFFPRLAHLQLDGRAVLVAIACMLVTTVFFGLLSGHAPAYQAGREMDRRDRGRDALIVMQVALASILLLGASLLFQSFLRLRAVDPGFDPDRILSVRVNSSAERTAFIRNATEQLSRLPEVESVGASNVTPFSGEGTANRFRLEGEPGSEFHAAAWRAVTPGFFTTLGVPLRRGRLFSEADRNGSLEVVILSESMARQFWPNQDPIGQRLLWGKSGSPKTIVGVVGDLRDLAVNSPPTPTMFRPFSQLSDAPMTLLIRTRQEPALAISAVRRQVAALDRKTALECRSLRQAMSDSILRPRASLMAVGAFASVALLSAAFGLYGLITYRVNQRQQEIGIRLALGASSSSVRWSVQKRCLLLVGWGVALGLPVAFALSRLMSSLLYDTPPSQTAAYLVDLLIFITVGLLASFGPAHRASRMDPAAAIRHE